MQVIPRCRSLLNFGNSGISRVYSFHSTPVCDEKWKKKWNSDFRTDRQQSKSYNKYLKRRMRADAKRALRNLGFNCGLFDNIFQSSDRPKGKKKKKSSWEGWNLESEYDSDCYSETERSNPFSGKRGAKRNPSRRQRRVYFTEDDEDDEPFFHARFGNKFYSWSFNPFRGSFHSFTSGFEHEEDSRRRYGRREWSEAEDDIGSNTEAGKIGLRSERTMLGLPPYGPLKIEDVKNAFRLSALKWHPDKHQGPSQAEAEEKFKHCVNAYNSLRTALSAA